MLLLFFCKYRFCLERYEVCVCLKQKIDCDLSFSLVFFIFVLVCNIFFTLFVCSKQKIDCEFLFWLFKGVCSVGVGVGGWVGGEMFVCVLVLVFSRRAGTN